MIEDLVVDRFPDLDTKPTLSLIPQGDLQEFYLPLTAFSLEPHAKSGCLGPRFSQV